MDVFNVVVFFCMVLLIISYNSIVIHNHTSKILLASENCTAEAFLCSCICFIFSLSFVVSWLVSMFVFVLVTILCL